MHMGSPHAGLTCRMQLQSRASCHRRLGVFSHEGLVRAYACVWTKQCMPQYCPTHLSHTGEDDGVPRAALGPCPQCGSELALYAYALLCMIMPTHVQTPTHALPTLQACVRASICCMSRSHTVQKPIDVSAWNAACGSNKACSAVDDYGGVLQHPTSCLAITVRSVHNAHRTVSCDSLHVVFVQHWYPQASTPKLLHASSVMGLFAMQCRCVVFVFYLLW